MLRLEIEEEAAVRLAIFFTSQGACSDFEHTFRNPLLLTEWETENQLRREWDLA